ncbi:hypothetical protein V8B97DRAFT_1917667 [Scleroderma yunnanense]
MVVASTRTPRKSTLSLREFSHLVSESLDVSNSANMSLLAHSTLFSETEKAESPGCSEDVPSPRKMAFAWPFTRASPNKQRSTRDEPYGLETSDAHAQKLPDPVDKSTVYSNTAASVASLAAGSTSSLGSLIPPNEQFFSTLSRDDSFDDCDHSRISFRDTTSSPITFAKPHSPPRAVDQSPASPRSPVESLFASMSPTSVLFSSEADQIGIALTSEDIVRESTETCPPSTTSEGYTSEDDPTPRAATFSERAVAPLPLGVGHSSVLAQRRREYALSLMIPAGMATTLPGGIETPSYTETETEGEHGAASSSVVSPSSCTSITSFPGLALPHQGPTMSSTLLPPVYRPTALGSRSPSPVKLPDMLRNPPSPRPSSSQGSMQSHLSGGERGRAGSRSTKSPPPLIPGPPPSCPLPAVPGPVSVQPGSSGQPYSGPGLRAPVPLLAPASAPVLLSMQVAQFPPVPPLPPALKMKHSALLAQSPPSNLTSSLNSSTIVPKSQPHVQVPILVQGQARSPSKSPSKSQAQMQTQSPPGTLRLPSRLGRNAGATLDGLLTSPSSGRGPLPSPPESPTKGCKRIGFPGSPSRKALGSHSPKMMSAPTLTPPHTLRRPTSIGVGILEAASVASAVGNAAIGSDTTANVRRTKSILLLGSRSKFAFAFGGGSSGGSSPGSGGCAGTHKRVQIRAESEDGHGHREDDEDERHGHFCSSVGMSVGDKGGKEGKDGKEAGILKRDRRKSSLALMNIGLSIGKDRDKERGREAQSAKRASDPTPGPSTSAPADAAAPQLLVLRERRHSAPLLSRTRARTRSRLTMNGDSPKEIIHTRESSLDWTLLLPFSTDVPGGKIFPSLSPKDGASIAEYECGASGLEEEKEDWTLCMPLKVRVEAPPELPPIQDKSEGGSDQEGEEDGHKPVASLQDSQPDLGREHDSDSVCDSSQDHDLRPGHGAEDRSLEKHMQHIDLREQLPTPSPSPTPSSPHQTSGPLVRIHAETEHELCGGMICESDGGLDIDGGRGKRGSGWNVFGWFGDDTPESICESEDAMSHDWSSMTSSTMRRIRGRSHDIRVHTERHPRHGSTGTLATTATAETVYYSARSSWLVGYRAGIPFGLPERAIEEVETRPRIKTR